MGDGSERKRVRKVTKLKKRQQVTVIPDPLKPDERLTISADCTGTFKLRLPESWQFVPPNAGAPA